MNTKYILSALCVALTLGTVSCSNDDNVTAEIEEPIYNVEDNTSDPIQHRKFEMYRDYKTYLITNPITRDYKYNFQKKNNLLITAPEQSPELIKKGIKMLDDMFLNHYSEEFKKKYMPFSILLADSIFFLGQETGRPYYHSYVANRFLALGGVRKEMGSYTEAQKRDFEGDINSRYWMDYLWEVKSAFSIPEAFSDVNREYFKKEAGESKAFGKVTEETQPDDLDYHTLGFISYNHRTTFYDKEWSSWWIELPDEDTDRRQWVAFIFSTPKAERDALIAKYSKMKEKYDILKEAFLKCDGYDIEKLP
ncbi:hypothetical protein HMPREF3034_02200 [Prevotella sp. DNF00663]|uniref:hypothetical protein n=1 Tax=Prevotella sp. DNF00663 TaxID=1384078 RepID=UPI000785B3F1|nr:hypothetical protein [Prevotella sp. DNF00663]KXB79201.1 hypothetical protein HMPREF3034_02200 [Prevotella sp. DNF00663]